MVKLYLSSQTQTLTNVHERGSWAGRAYTFQLLAGGKIWIIPRKGPEQLGLEGHPEGLWEAAVYQRCEGISVV